MNQILYFGCANHEPGHFVFDTNLCRVKGQFALEFARNDGKLAPYKKVGQPQGKANVAWCEEYVILAFWDRSVDSRPGSNAMFLIPYSLIPREEHTGDEVLRRAREAFPSIFARFKFPVEVVSQGTYAYWKAEM